MYSLGAPAKCVVSVLGDQDRHSFLSASMKLRDKNEIHHVIYDDDENKIECEAVYEHEHEISSISCAPTDPGLFFTSYSNMGDMSATLWKISKDKLEEKFSISGSTNEMEKGIKKVVLAPRCQLTISRAVGQFYRLNGA